MKQRYVIRVGGYSHNIACDSLRVISIAYRMASCYGPIAEVNEKGQCANVNTPRIYLDRK